MTKEKDRAAMALEAGGRLLWSALRGCAYREFSKLAAVEALDGYFRISLELTGESKRDHVEAMVRAHMPNCFSSPQLISLAFVGRGCDERAVIIFAAEGVDRATVSRARAYMQSISVRAMVSYPVDYNSDVTMVGGRTI